ncbi:MAG: hypothetical protein M3N19_11530 [Candidatus Eremiobacteraeota bacterium]|nr:hypothetical protein [Candidatus Eremiobacteraeota bacterium]
MCVQSARPVTRAEILASFAGASLLVFGKPVLASETVSHSVPLPLAPATLTAGAARAERIVQQSAFIRNAFSQVDALASGIRDAALRTAIRSLLHDPVPQYAVALRASPKRAGLRDELLRAGFIEKIDTIDALLPSENNDFSRAAQPFWTAAGSAQDSHHAYPGGLVIHELFNARAAVALAAEYNSIYFGGSKTISQDVVVAAALYHDIMKTVVFQWGDDGKLSSEPTIAGTGAHHVLSAAEAIARGHGPEFVTVVLSAHAAPSLGDETKVIAWARAAAMIAGVDPVAFGLIKRTGKDWMLARPAPIEAFINNLSDHDYVLSVNAMHEVAPRVDSMIEARSGAERLWVRNGLLANISAIRLYGLLTRGEREFQAAVQSGLSNLKT